MFGVSHPPEFSGQGNIFHCSCYACILVFGDPSSALCEFPSMGAGLHRSPSGTFLPRPSSSPRIPSQMENQQYTSSNRMQEMSVSTSSDSSFIQYAQTLSPAPVYIRPYWPYIPEEPKLQAPTTSHYHQSSNNSANVMTNQTLSRDRLAFKLFGDAEIITRLKQYILEPSQLKDLGFPVQYGPDTHRATINYTPYDVATSNAEGGDTPEPESNIDGLASEPDFVTRTCSRCNLAFYTECRTGHYLREEECMYHWGKLQTSHGERRWTCCQNDANSEGCDIADAHVWCGLQPGNNGPFKSYMRTRPSEVPEYEPSAYALDCEMIYTLFGLEVAKVTVVDIDGLIVYDTYVRPQSMVVDYNTRFSGITAEHLSSSRTYLPEVQERLSEFIFSDTILIGHGLENDLRALRLIHDNIIDTSICFRHSNGLPYRYGLKTLVKKILKREIQMGAHDSCVDAQAVMDLMIHRVTVDAIGDEALEVDSF